MLPQVVKAILKKKYKINSDNCMKKSDSWQFLYSNTDKLPARHDLLFKLRESVYPTLKGSKGLILQ